MDMKPDNSGRFRLEELVEYHGTRRTFVERIFRRASRVAAIGGAFALRRMRPQYDIGPQPEHTETRLPKLLPLSREVG